MNNLISLVLTLASAFALPSIEIKSRNLVVPAGRPEGRITRGHDAVAGQFPYQVGISVKSSETRNFWCGGSLLNSEWVLTMAHCTSDVLQLTVYLGSIHLLSGEVEHLINPEKCIVHQGYNKITNENDISLIKIPYTKYSDNIKPVKLPALSQSYSDYNGESAIVAGWGGTTNPVSTFPTTLQWARLNVIPNAVCKRNFHQVISSNICTATIGGVNTCDGDSGGPLVLESSNTQIGIIFYGTTNCLEDYPSVYIRITSYLEWIKKNTNISYKICSSQS